MLFGKGPHLNLNWVSPGLAILAIIVCTTLRYLHFFSAGRYVALLFNSVGTILLASGFEANIPKVGMGGYWESLKAAAKEFPDYGSPPSFDFLRFYIGLSLLIVGIIVSGVVS